ncbi:uncharacterized protein FTOL_13908 [Fusarium torulosum]|uniref:Uncharacterized protein n=1 Tax=Fusarium torulosum TaxID=33205 RepID=A0AAE8SQA4_9HYPO|nr:uncharacterized protein FTOL_13908 [Fusarium torulosum]
MSEADCLV